MLFDDAMNKNDLDLILKYAANVRAQSGSYGRYLKFIARSLVKGEQALRWYRFLEEHVELSSASAEVKGVLADKIHRPFARCAFSTQERIDLLTNHYLEMEKLFLPEVLRKIVAGQPLELTRFSGREADENFTVTFCRNMLSQHQGELTFLMTEEKTGIPMARLVANIDMANGQRIFVVNGIQGPLPAHKKDIVRITRHLNGLRPKRVVLEAAYSMALWMKADRLIAISKQNHVSQAKTGWKKKVVAEYDEFWAEFDPTILENGDYLLPMPLPQRKIEDVIPKKRKDWLLRQERLAAIDAAVWDALAHLGDES
jgi:uncharacterized protein VirK/YbjX